MMCEQEQSHPYSRKKYRENNWTSKISSITIILKDLTIPSEKYSDTFFPSIVNKTSSQKKC